MERVGTSKWEEYVFNNESEFPESEHDATIEEYAEEDISEFNYGSDCVVDKNDNRTKHWIPRCPTSLKPVEGMRFHSLEEAEAFYFKYAATVGFVVRKSSKRKFSHSEEISNRYLCCNRSGFKNIGNSTGKRNTTTTRVGCKAWANFKYAGKGEYVVTNFFEQHNHEMIEPNARHLMKSNKKMEIGHKKFMLSCAKANLGPVGAHNLLKHITGGYNNLNVTSRQFRNYKRDLMTCISGADAQMTIDKFKNKKDICSEFYFEYTLNEANQLTKIFWSDPLSRRNYAAFGQVVSFDSTYDTNMYNMVFAPFTGLDNHKRSVHFACGLLMKEDIESYTWLFQQFKKAMHSEPTIIVIDQDCAMKAAIENVFEHTRHRLCMWHIMEKVPTKIGAKKLNEPRLRKELGNLVWRDQLTTIQFEEGWDSFTTDHNLRDNPWLNDMYNLRAFWIPAYFRDIVLGGLIRTTSISESQNSFFGKYSNKTYNLVELMVHFDIALEKQRHDQVKHNVESDTSSYELKTPLDIEKHAFEIFTLKVFSQIQEEINDACFYCCVVNEDKCESFVDYTIREGSNDLFEVRYMVSDGFTTCTCMMFNRIGLPCCHIFAALKSIGCKKILDSLIIPRWLKGATRTLNTSELGDVFKQSAQMERMGSKKIDLWSTIYACVGLADNDEMKLDPVLDELKRLKSRLEGNEDDATIANTSIADMEEFVGIAVPDEVVVLPPSKAENKGSGKGRRKKGGKEIAIEAQKKAAAKGKRKCRKCGQSTGHDSRNCKEIQLH